MENYEQKYKKALEIAKVVNPGTKDYNIVTTIFPELKESNDERIRKELLDYLDKRRIVETPVDTKVKEEWIAWLEKQGEQKQISITEEWIENYWQHEKVNNPNSYDNGDEIQFDHDGFIRFCKDIANR